MKLCARLLNAANATVTNIVAGLIVPTMARLGRPVTPATVMAKITELCQRDTGAAVFDAAAAAPLSEADKQAIAAKDQAIAGKGKSKIIVT